MSSDKSLDQAISIIEHSRQTHVDWKTFIDQYPEEANKPRPEVETAGDSSWHQKCIEDYDIVLKVLKSKLEDNI